MYNNDIEALIKKRKSTRTYSDRQITKAQKGELMAFAEALTNDTYRYAIIDLNLGDNVKVGTYGYIKNAKTYLAAIADKTLAEDYEKAVDFGYDFEKIILKATDMGIDTCWMGASYKEKELLEAVGAKENERIAMMTPLGFGKGSHLMDRITRTAISADKRKAFGKVFFDGKWEQGLSDKGDATYVKVLEMVRLSPSAGNGQPWRVVKTEDGYDFYAVGKMVYDNMPNKRVDFTHNDLGIAKLHFELAAEKYGLTGRFAKKSNVTIAGKKYVYSWLSE